MANNLVMPMSLPQLNSISVLPAAGSSSVTTHTSSGLGGDEPCRSFNTYGVHAHTHADIEMAHAAGGEGYHLPALWQTASRKNISTTSYNQNRFPPEAQPGAVRDWWMRKRRSGAMSTPPDGRPQHNVRAPCQQQPLCPPGLERLAGEYDCWCFLAAWAYKGAAAQRWTPQGSWC